MPTDDLDRFCCQNPDCTHHGRRGAGNLSICGYYGKAQHRLLYCRTCKARFSEFKGTPLFNSKLPHDKVLAILQHLADGCGVRATARLCKVGRNTVLRFTQRFGQHAELFHDQEVRHVDPKQIQPDEAWTFVGKKRQAL